MECKVVIDFNWDKAIADCEVLTLTLTTMTQYLIKDVVGALCQLSRVTAIHLEGHWSHGAQYSEMLNAIGKLPNIKRLTDHTITDSGLYDSNFQTGNIQEIRTSSDLKGCNKMQIGTSLCAIYAFNGQQPRDNVTLAEKILSGTYFGYGRCEYAKVATQLRFNRALPAYVARVRFIVVWCLWRKGVPKDIIRYCIIPYMRRDDWKACKDVIQKNPTWAIQIVSAYKKEAEAIAELDGERLVERRLEMDIRNGKERLKRVRETINSLKENLHLAKEAKAVAIKKQRR